MRILFTLRVLFFFLSAALSTLNSDAAVDHSDSLIFDISQAIINGNQIDIPVLIHSDDTIYALDFALTYDHTILTFDSVLNATPYIQSFYYYNVSDSTLRFTSNSLHEYAIDSPLVFVRFTMNNGMMSTTDINNSLSLLNGDTCSSEIIDPLGLNIRKTEQLGEIIMYPNPAKNILYIKSDYSKMDIIDISGRIVFSVQMSGHIDTGFLTDGFYVCRFYKDGQSNEKLLLVSH
jgi:hypothetical protein